MVNLVEKYGGLSIVHSVVEVFYDRVLDEDSLADFFIDIDMKKLVEHQTKLISSLMGGPGEVSDHRLREAHTGLGIKEADFTLIAEILENTLGDSGFSSEDTKSLMSLVAAKKHLILA